MESADFGTTAAPPRFFKLCPIAERYGIHAEKEPDAVVRPAVDFIPGHPIVPSI
jgi:hypothetical protein